MGKPKKGKKPSHTQKPVKIEAPPPLPQKRVKIEGGGKRSSNKARNIESQRAKENTEIPLVYR